MLVPLNWLREFVDLPPDVGGLVERLTVAGLEVTSVRAIGVPLPAGLRAKAGEEGLVWDRDKVQVARVLKIEMHPQADKLRMVTLDSGTGTPKTVITGAPNIAPGESGQLVVLGLVNSQYFSADKNGVKTIQTLVPKALRGIDNDAMCLSDYELGLSEDHEGIILLDEQDATPGTPAQDVLGGVVVEIDVLPNMARCLGLAGIAREVAALTGGTVRTPPLAAHTNEGKPLVTITIDAPQLCSRYLGCVVEGVRVGPAPRRLRSHLQAAGQRPINVVVDITNAVLFEFGQPLHAFDFDVLLERASGKTPQIVVRSARAGETLVTLDGTIRELTSENLLIADVAGPIALAGVMGGRDTQVTASTTRVLIESATFDAVSVRKTARQFNLFSESSTRFSRGLHPANAELGMRRALKMLADYAGGQPVGPVVDEYPTPAEVRIIELKCFEIERILGVSIPKSDVETTLRALDFEVDSTEDGWLVKVPPGRLDVQAGPADLIEDLIRIVGYERLPERLLAAELPPPTPDPAADLEDRIRDRLAELGLFEAVTYSLSSLELESRLHPPATGDYSAPAFVELLNPISPERAVMRRSLMPGLLMVAQENLRHSLRAALFECGPVYWPRDGEPLPTEPRRLAIVLAGSRSEPPGWDAPAGTTAPATDFYDLKGVVEGLLTALGISGEFQPTTEPIYLHPKRSAAIRVVGQAESLGTLGELHPQVTRAFGFKSPPLVAEFDLGVVAASLPARTGYRPVSPFEKVLRDVAVVVPEEMPAATVLIEIQAGGAGLLEAVQLFDVYRGASIPSDTKSLAFALTYRVADRELSAKEVDKTHQKIEGRLRHVLKAKIRGQDL